MLLSTNFPIFFFIKVKNVNGHLTILTATLFDSF